MKKTILLLAAMTALAWTSAHRVQESHVKTCSGQAKDNAESRPKLIAATPLPGYGKKCPIGQEYRFTYTFVKRPKVGTATLKVQVFDRHGKKNTDLAVYGDSGMPSMPGTYDSGMVPFKTDTKGDYLLPVNIAVAGEWEIRLHFKKDGKQIFCGVFRFRV